MSKKLAIGLWAFIGIVGLAGYWGSERKAASETAATQAAERKEEAKQKARTKFLAANPKIAAAERAEKRKGEVQKQQEQQAARKREAKAQEQAEQAKKQRIQVIEKSLKDSFGQPGYEATWYLAVKRRYEFVDGDLEIRTNIPKVPSSHLLHEEWDNLAKATCLAVAGANPDKSVKTVRVLSDDGRELMSLP